MRIMRIMRMRMMMISSNQKAKSVILTITPMITGSISFAASLTIIISILCSNTKLSTSYRRLVFGISVYDLFQSICQAVSSMPMPVSVTSGGGGNDVWLAFGNDTTCAVQSVVFTIGYTGTLLYSLALTIYFLLVVKYNTDDSRIKKYVEPILHVVPIVWSCVFSICMLLTYSYGPVGKLCWINSRGRPDDEEGSSCQGRDDDHLDDIDCSTTSSNSNNNNMKANNPEMMLTWIAGGLLIGVFLLNCIMMVMIWLAVKVQIKKSQSYRYSWMTTSALSPRISESRGPDQDQEDLNHSNTTTNSSSSSRCCSRPSSLQSCLGSVSSSLSSIVSSIVYLVRNKQEGVEGQISSSALAARLSRPSQASIRTLKDTSNRAIGYVVGFLLTYTLPLIQRVIEIYGSSPPPFAMVFISRFLYPLQGLFNIIVYTHPHVVSYRRNHSEESWLRAFLKVVKSGGDSDRDELPSGRRRRSSLVNQRKAVELETFNKNNKIGERNSSSNSRSDVVLSPSPSTLDQLVLTPTINSPPIERENPISCIVELNDIRKLSPIDHYIDCEEGSEEYMRNVVQSNMNHDMDMFPIASSNLMESDLDNLAVASDIRV
mmetsp:Transcript_13064/g.19794  ORF Transcript_13064/g.19794 Transcript_13064/m.19794 type:complete len:600 (-) Transcript_13064:164-1963(-)